MIKRVILASALVFAPATYSAGSYFSTGFYFGSPSSGVTLKVADQYKYSVGVVDEFSLAADMMWNLGDITMRPEYGPFYSYAGLQWVNGGDHNFGPRAGVGMEMPLGNGNVHFFAELGPTWYMLEEATIDLEGALGLRVDL